MVLVSGGYARNRSQVTGKMMGQQSIRFFSATEPNEERFYRKLGRREIGTRSSLLEGVSPFQKLERSTSGSGDNLARTRALNPNLLCPDPTGLVLEEETQRG